MGAEEDWTSGVPGVVLGLSGLGALAALGLLALAAWARCRRRPAADGAAGSTAADERAKIPAAGAAWHDAPVDPKSADGLLSEVTTTQVVPVRPARGECPTTQTQVVPVRPARGECSTTQVERVRPSGTAARGRENGEARSTLGSSPSEEGGRLGAGDPMQVVKECAVPGQVDEAPLNKVKVYQGTALQEADGAAAVAWPAPPPALASLGQRSALPPISGQVAPVSSSRSFTERDKGRKHKGTQLEGGSAGGRRYRKSKDPATDRGAQHGEGAPQEAPERCSRAAPSEVGAHSLWAESEII